MKNKLSRTSTRRRTTGIIAIGFLMIIAVGTILLTLPISSVTGNFTNPIDAAFTAVSATCVTGLITVDTGIHWNIFGQIVILLMIQIGGLGFMTLAVLMLILIRRAVTPKERMLLAMSYNIDNYDSTRELFRRMWIGTVIIEIAGAAVLSTRFIPIFGFWDGIYKSIFHSVSAFCNAGFDILGKYSGEFKSLELFSGDITINVTIMLLIIIGGIGFIVWNDIANMIVKKKRISVYSRLVLLVTAILIVGGTAFFAILEWDNPDTLGNMPVWQKIMAAAFQSVTLRTAGYASINQGAMTQSSQLASVLLMFIGGASGSTAGGVKVGTVGILVYTIWSVSLGNKETVLFKRRVSTDSVMRAISVVGFQLLFLIIGTIVVSASMDCSVIAALFESASASGTVGVTLGITPSLNFLSKLVIMLLMYLGRVGVLTVTYAVMVNMHERSSLITYPDANILIG